MSAFLNYNESLEKIENYKRKLGFFCFVLSGVAVLLKGRGNEPCPSSGRLLYFNSLFEVKQKLKLWTEIKNDKDFGGCRVNVIRIKAIVTFFCLICCYLWIFLLACCCVPKIGIKIQIGSRTVEFIHSVNI